MKHAYKMLMISHPGNGLTLQNLTLMGGNMVLKFISHKYGVKLESGIGWLMVIYWPAWVP
jgi:hypothetical protein